MVSSSWIVLVMLVSGGGKGGGRPRTCSLHPGVWMHF
jgi:hypothetical protein